MCYFRQRYTRKCHQVTPRMGKGFGIRGVAARALLDLYSCIHHFDIHRVYK